METESKVMTTAEAAEQNGRRCAYTSVLGDSGLTKRELFAAMAMQGLCANDPLMRASFRDAGRKYGTDTHEHALAATRPVAHFAVSFADALLLALSEKAGEANG